MASATFSTVIMTHPARVTSAEQLRQRLLPAIEAEIVVDPDPDGVPVALRTARLAWRLADGGSSHHLVLQDDAVPCTNFSDHMTALVSANPQAAMSLFAHWSTDTSYLVRCAALLRRSTVPVLDSYVGTQALVVRSEVAAQIAAALDRAGYDDPEDVVIGRSLRELRVPTLVAVPNLVQHAPLPSLTGRQRNGLRRATCFSDTPHLDAGTATLDAPGLLPCFNARIRKAGILALPARHYGRRRIAELFDFLGVPAGTIESEYELALRSSTMTGGYGDLFSDDAVREAGREVFLIAVALGVMACKHGSDGADVILGRLSDDNVHLAFSTMMPALLNLRVPIAPLLENEGALTKITLQAVATGLQLAARCGDWPRGEAELGSPPDPAST